MCKLLSKQQKVNRGKALEQSQSQKSSTSEVPFRKLTGAGVTYANQPGGLMLRSTHWTKAEMGKMLWGPTNSNQRQQV